MTIDSLFTINKQTRSIQLDEENGKQVYLINVKKNNETREIKINVQNGLVGDYRPDSYNELDEGQSEEYVEEISQVGYIDSGSILIR